jgi:hypothetical protein
VSDPRVTILMLDLAPDVRVRIRAPRLLSSREWDLLLHAAQAQREATFQSTQEVLQRTAVSECRSILDKSGLPTEERMALLREVGSELGLIDGPEARALLALRSWWHLEDKGRSQDTPELTALEAAARALFAPDDSLKADCEGERPR